MTDGVFEDIGYDREAQMDKHYTLTKSNFQKDVKRIRYTQGIMEGREMNIRTDIADDLIRRGKAVPVRSPGQEG